MSQTTIRFATPLQDVKFEECLFYTVQDIPGLTEPTKGEWDLRCNTPAYLGNVEFNGKSVLELGPASGYLTFYMEQKGANVTSIDLSIEDNKWDVVPNCRRNWVGDVTDHMKGNLRRVQNAYWFAHNAYNSSARVVYAHAYNIPQELGRYDIAVIAAVLLHLENPFLALQNVLRLTEGTAIITDMLPSSLTKRNWFRNSAELIICRMTNKNNRNQLPFIEFLPNSENDHNFAWWLLSPELIVRIASLFGFGKASINHHRQRQNGILRDFYTVVCQRTVPIAECKY